MISKLLIKEAFVYIFKQNNWQVKLLLNFVVVFCTLVPFWLINQTVYSDIEDYSDLMNAVILGAAISLVVFGIPALVMTSWYEYEATQAAMFDRTIKDIWKPQFGDVLKKVLKYISVGLVYTLVLLPFVIVIACFWGLILTLMYLPFSQGDISDNSIFSLIITLPIMFVATLVTLPPFLRLFYTNTFTEGINFNANWYITKKYLKELVLLTALNEAPTLVWNLLSLVIFYIYRELLVENELVAVLFLIVALIPVILFGVYYMLFVFTYISGKVYKTIVAQENWNLVSSLSN